MHCCVFRWLSGQFNTCSSVSLYHINGVPCAIGILGFREDSEQEGAGVLQVGGQSLPAAAGRPQQA